MKDVFPPETPAGLLAVLSFAGGQVAAIDLSWEPNMEPRIAGYRVYRRDLGGEGAGSWRLLTAEVLPVVAYRDLSVAAGMRYAYRVTAVSGAGVESTPSAEVVAGPVR
jgi:fibronectin type 3 domain-containing protein